MITMILVALGTSAAWFIFEAHYFTPSFETSVIKTYFDAESGDGKTASTPFLITKPVHLYNLAYLQDKGIFNGDTFYFELGKKNTALNDGEYYFYTNEGGDETSTTNLTKTNLDMSISTSYDTIYPIGTFDYGFDDSFVGNNKTITNLKVISKSDMAYNGFFGYVDDGATLKDFNLDEPTINNPSTNTNSVTTGLVVGYFNATSLTSITYSGIGVNKGKITGNGTVSSEYSLIGGGTTYANTAINGFLDSGNNSGDTGYIDFDSFSGRNTNPTTGLYDSSKSGYEDFGIFSFNVGSNQDFL